MHDTPDMSLVASVTIDHVRSAARALEGVANQTPIMTSRTIDAMTGAAVVFKCESFQRVGAFKFRGAYHALSRLGDDERARGVLTYSSGNHAQALALASRLLGIDATIVMPSDAPRIKLDATRGYLDGTDGRVVLYDKREVTREELGGRIARERGLTIIPPYDHPDVIAGQGTAALELLTVVGELDALFVPCGGGGLLSGCAVVCKALAPGCRVVGVEPAAADDATRSFRERRLHTVHNPETIADGARTPSLGRYTFPLVLTHVDEMTTAGEGEIVSAMRLLWERCKLVVEPTGALGLAGTLRAASIRGQRVGVIVSGGNVECAAMWESLLE